MNPQRVELVPHSALSARLRWTRFLLQSLRRPLGYTECPHLDPDSPVAEHNASKVSSQQRRGFHPTCHMHCKQMRAKKRNEPPKGRTCPSQCSKCPSPWTRSLLQSLRRPLGDTECPHLNPDSPVAEHNASKVSSQQRRGFHPTCHMHCKQMRAKKRNEPPKGRTCPSQCSECPSDGPDSFLLQSLRRPLGYTECPHLDPDSPVAEHNASKVNSQQRRGFHPTCHMHCKQMRAKKRNEPPKGGTCPSQCSKCPSPMDPIPLAVAAAPPWVHGMPSLGPRLPSGRAQRFKSQQSAAQRFSPYLPHALQANESQKTQ